MRSLRVMPPQVIETLQSPSDLAEPRPLSLQRLFWNTSVRLYPCYGPVWPLNCFYICQEACLYATWMSLGVFGSRFRGLFAANWHRQRLKFHYIVTIPEVLCICCFPTHDISVNVIVRLDDGTPAEVVLAWPLTQTWPERSDGIWKDLRWNSGAWPESPPATQSRTKDINK